MDGTNEIGKEVLHIPFGDLISSVANGIAEAQFKLDQSSMNVAEMMSGQKLVRDINGAPIKLKREDGTETFQVIDSRVFFGKDKLSMIELGFVPNFYHFVDTVIDMKVTMRITKVENEYKVFTAPVDGHYASSYSFDLNLAASVSTKLVPVPPPTLLEERIKAFLTREYDIPEPPTPPAAELSDQPASELPTQKAEPEPPPAEQSEPEDDLTKIKGVGKKYSGALKKEGYTTYAKIADATAEELKEALIRTNNTYDIANTDDWPEQAKALGFKKG